jgi:hypothetical protein
LFEESGDAGHAVGGDVFEGLDHGGPGFEARGVEFVVAGGEFDEAAAGLGERVEACGVGGFCGGLLGDAAAVFGTVEVVLGELAEFVVGLVELLFAVVAFASGTEPFGELLGEPEGVVGLVENMDDKGRGVGAFAAGQIVFGPGSDFERLGSNSLARRAKGGEGGEFGFFGGARGRDFFAKARAFCWGGTGCQGGSPLEADPLDTEIVAGGEVEADDLGVEDDGLEGFFAGGDARWFVFDGLDFEEEGVFGRKAVGVPPGEAAGLGSIDWGELGEDALGIEVLWSIVEEGCGEGAVDPGFESGLGAFEERDGGSAHEEAGLCLIAEVIREAEKDGEFGEFGARTWEEGEGLTEVAQAEAEGQVVFLRGNGELVGA